MKTKAVRDMLMGRGSRNNGIRIRFLLALTLLTMGAALVTYLSMNANHAMKRYDSRQLSFNQQTLSDQNENAPAHHADRSGLALMKEQPFEDAPTVHGAFAFAGTGGDVTLDLDAGTVAERDSTAALPAVREVVVDAAGGHLRVLGRSSDNALRYRVTGANSGILTLDGDPAKYIVENIGPRRADNEFPVSIYGGEGNDVLTVRLDGMDATDNQVRYDGGAGNDTLITAGRPGTPVGETIYSPGPGNTEGIVHFASANGEPMMTVDFAGLEPVVDVVPAATLTVNATNADNAVTYTQGGPMSNGKVSVDSFETIEFSNKNSLVLNGMDGADTIVLNNDLTPTGLTSITINGGEGNDWLEAADIRSGTLTLNGDAGDDTLIGGGTTEFLNGGDGDDTLVNGYDDSTFDGNSGPDEVVYRGSVTKDVIAITQLDFNSFAYSFNNIPQTEFIDGVDKVVVEMNGGDDIVTVTHADTLSPNLCRLIVVQGIGQSDSNILNVVDDGDNDISILRHSADGVSGSVTVAPGQAGIPGSVTQYKDINRVNVIGEYVVFPYDVFENNNTPGAATVIDTNASAHLTIDPAGDVDYFKLIAAQTGLLDIRSLYDVIGILSPGHPGLPGDGQLVLELTDANLNLITTSPDHITVPAVAGETYLLKVSGVANAINAYNLVLGNDPLPVPTGVSLDPDDAKATTTNPTPRFIVHVDLRAMAAAGVTILTPAQAAGGTTPGVAVQVAITDTTIGTAVQGYATAIGGSLTEFEFTPTIPLDPGAYSVAASVKLFDGQQVTASGESTLSVPLDLQVLGCDGLPAGANSLTFGPVPDAAFVSASDALYKNRVRVTWPEVAGASEYLVYRATMADLSDAQLLGQVTQDLFFDDYSVGFTQAMGGCMAGKLIPITYYYQVFASGPCISTALIGDDAGSPRSDEATAQYVLPAGTDLLGYQSISDVSSLSVQVLGGSSSIDSAQVWGIIHADTALNGANVSIDTSAKVIGQNLWVTYTPSILWQPGEIITMTVGATTSGGGTFGPVTYAFKVDSTKNLAPVAELPQRTLGDATYATADLARVLDAEQLPDLEGAVGDAYTILPEGPYTEPAWIWLAVPTGVDPSELEVAYLHYDGIQSAWVPGRLVENWLADDEPVIVTADGVTRIGHLVTHSGTVCLAPQHDAANANPAGIATPVGTNPVEGLGALLPLAIALAAVTLRRRREA